MGKRFGSFKKAKLNVLKGGSIDDFFMGNSEVIDVVRENKEDGDVPANTTPLLPYFNLVDFKKTLRAEPQKWIKGYKNKEVENLLKELFFIDGDKNVLKKARKTIEDTFSDKSLEKTFKNLKSDLSKLKTRIFDIEKNKEKETNKKFIEEQKEYDSYTDAKDFVNETIANWKDINKVEDVVDKYAIPKISNEIDEIFDVIMDFYNHFGAPGAIEKTMNKKGVYADIVKDKIKTNSSLWQSLFFKYKSKGWDDDTLKKKMKEEIEKYNNPKIKVWQNRTGLDGYKIKKGLGSYDGKKIHVTFDLNSTKSPGNIKGKTVDDLLKSLLKLDDYSYEIHATLEVDAVDKNPHYYYGGTEKFYTGAVGTGTNRYPGGNHAKAAEEMKKVLDKFIEDNVKPGVEMLRDRYNLNVK